MNHFTSVKDVKDLDSAVQQALTFKKQPNQPDRHTGKRVGLIFFNPSLRTRLSSIVAAQNLGAEAVVLDVRKDGWALEYGEGVKMDGDKAEHIKEAAAVMGAYFDLLAIRTFPSLISREEDYSELVLNSFIEFAGVPIVSLESATGHPLQAFADLITIKEQWLHQRKPKVVLSWAPHVKALPQAVPNSFAQWMNAAELDLTITHPRGYELSPEFAGTAQVTYDQKEAFQDADFVYVKNWSSFQDYGQVLSKDENWRITFDHLKNTSQAKVMHCLPVRRGIVIDDEVLDSPNAIHLEQAKNRVYAAQTVLNSLL